MNHKDPFVGLACSAPLSGCLDEASLGVFEDNEKLIRRDASCWTEV